MGFSDQERAPRSGAGAFQSGAHVVYRVSRRGSAMQALS